MIHPNLRALPLVCTILAAGLAGCATNSAAPDKVKSLSQLPNKDQSMLKLGDTARAAGDCVAALRFYHLALEGEGREPDQVGVHAGIADCDVAMGNLAEAKKEYAAARTLAPDNPNPILGLGRIHLIEHDPAQAAPLLDLAITKGATGPWAWNDKGVAYDQLRRHKEAQDAYRAGLSRYPGDRALRNNYALSLAMTGNFAEAESIMRGLAQEPDATARTRLNLALVLGLKGNAAEAREASRNDLDGAALDNNARFYDYARATITGAPLPPVVPPAANKPNAALDPELKASAERAALAAATPVPPESRALIARAEAAKAAMLAPKPHAPPPREAAPPPVVEQVEVAPADPPPAPPQESVAAPPPQEAAAPPEPLVANSEGSVSLPPVKSRPVASTHTADAVPRTAGPVASSE